MLGSSRSPGQAAMLPIIYRESPVSAPPLRRTDKLMSHERTLELLVRGFCGRIATVGADGWPYCVPLLLFLQLYGELRRRERAEGYLWLLRIAAGIFVPHVIHTLDLHTQRWAGNQGNAGASWLSLLSPT